ncbi:S1/P1 nuclease [Flavobacterium sp.]|uniref:S1/P1 nuclease n=1 Tax=Flavobacterium sp. TaxID=239 RepID=UPI0026393EBF|nr:S1/P1 nuclease [Flavobacterium sp.]
MKLNLITITLTITLLINSNATFAWGHRGHALVAEVAFHYLDETTKKNVMQYLDGMTIEEAANWMDAIKSDHANDYMKPYHYIDFEKGSKEQPAGDNIVTVLNATLKNLDEKQKLSHDEIKQRILFLFHLIGDLHQPLHVGYPSDKGGNKVQVSFFGHGSNLHAMWDSDIIETRGTSLSDVLASKNYSAEEMGTVKKIDVIGWAKQSRGYLKNAYSLNNSSKINDMYVDNNYPIIKSQLLDAGIRLASVLEYYFKTN